MANFTGALRFCLDGGSLAGTLKGSNVQRFILFLCFDFDAKTPGDMTGHSGRFLSSFIGVTWNAASRTGTTVRLCATRERLPFISCKVAKSQRKNQVFRLRLQGGHAQDLIHRYPMYHQTHKLILFSIIQPDQPSDH
jgi:hypothetical protein